MIQNILLILLICFLLAIFIYQFNKITEHLSNNIDIYIITLKHDKRMKNIEKQKEKLEGNIVLFDAVKGDNIDIDKLINDGKVSKNFEINNKSRKRVLGCLLSHIGVYEEIKKGNKHGYSIVFEDDFNIKDNNFMEIVNTSVISLQDKNIDFDLLFLGNLENNYGKNIIDNIYYIDYERPLIGLHGYLINNKNIDKIIDSVGVIDKPIDLQIERLSKNNTINAVIISPVIVDQGGSDYSSINNMNIENYSSYM